MSFTTNHPAFYDSIMEAFINDGGLTRALVENDKMVRSHMRFVSYEHDGGILRMIILGECGMCSTSHIRNICNSTYSHDCLFPVLSLVFPVITRIDVVRSDDDDLEELVRGMGGRITTPFGLDVSSTFADLNHLCLDLHPEIDGEIKCRRARGDEACPDRGAETRRSYTTRCHCCWALMADSRVVGQDG